MTLEEENGPPMFKDPISPEEAAALYDRVFGKSTEVPTFRTWLGENDDRVRDFVKTKLGKAKQGAWIIDRASMLDAFEAQADRMLVVVEQERAADRTNEGEK